MHLMSCWRAGCTFGLNFAYRNNYDLRRSARWLLRAVKTYYSSGTPEPSSLTAPEHFFSPKSTKMAIAFCGPTRAVAPQVVVRRRFVASGRSGHYGAGGNGGLDVVKRSGIGAFGGCQLSSTQGSGWPFGHRGVLSRAQSHVLKRRSSRPWPLPRTA